MGKGLVNFCFQVALFNPKYQNTERNDQAAHIIVEIQREIAKMDNIKVKKVEVNDASVDQQQRLIVLC